MVHSLTLVSIYLILWLIIFSLIEREVANMDLAKLKVSIFADGADKAGMLEMYANPNIKGFTTNPTLMKKAGITNYETFARDIVEAIPDRSISFEVFSDEFSEMERQARKIATWGKNVSVKVPITNTRGESAIPLCRKLSGDGINLNVTALFTLEQVKSVVESVRGNAPCFISVFAGRIADAGVDPLPIMVKSLDIMRQAPNTQLIWASPREILNVIQANDIGCHVITVTNDILKKMNILGKDLNEFSLETVKMFYDDGKSAGFAL